MRDSVLVSFRRSGVWYRPAFLFASHVRCAERRNVQATRERLSCESFSLSTHVVLVLGVITPSFAKAI